jgi:Protein of unknown function (DUF3277)
MIGGALIDSGFPDGEFCKIEQSSQDYGDVVGTDGEVCRYPTNDHSATITITLLQSSACNARLSAINNLDKLLANGAGIGPMLIRDRTGTTVFAAAHSWIAKPPDAAFDRAPGPRAWMIRCSDLTRFDGGN